MTLWGTAISSGECPLWVISGHSRSFARRPLYPQKRTLTGVITMSALCQKQTSARLFDHLESAAVAQSCESKAVSAEGKPLHGAAKNSFMAKCKKSAEARFNDAFGSKADISA